MENVKKLCRNYDKIVNALDQNPVISKSEFLEINLKKMIKVKREGLATWSENAKKEYSEFYRKIQKQLKELENELLNLKIWQKNWDTEKEKKQVKFMKK